MKKLLCTLLILGSTFVLAMADSTFYVDNSFNSTMKQKFKLFMDEVDAKDKVETLHIRIDSGGGNVRVMTYMLNRILETKHKVITYNDGYCMSAAFMLFLAGDERVTGPMSIFMAHEVSYSVKGKVGEMETKLDIGKAWNVMGQAWIDRISGQVGLGRQLINPDKDMYITAQMMKMYKLATKIL